MSLLRSEFVDQSNHQLKILQFSALAVNAPEIAEQFEDSVRMTALGQKIGGDTVSEEIQLLRGANHRRALVVECAFPTNRELAQHYCTAFF